MKNFLMAIFMVVLVLCLCGSAGAQTTHYVGPDDSIQDAIDAAVNGDTVQVAAGTYTENLVWNAKSILLIGAGADVTTVDGGGNGSCLVMTNVPDTARVEGFTFTGGLAEDGGGMYNYYSSPTVTGCTFSGNSNCGMYNENSDPTINNCAFIDNVGHGMRNYNNSSPTVTDCEFTSNSRGMHNFDSSPTVTNCEFTGNSGGGMYNAGSLGIGSSSTVTGCTFTGNGDPYVSMGGGICNFYHGNSTVTDCTFTGNTAYRGGGIHNDISSSESTVTNCKFIGNTAWEGGGMSNWHSSPTVTGCAFIGNKAGNGGGMSNKGGFSNFCEPTVTNCAFSDNKAYEYGGGMYNSYGDPTITNCIIWGNTAGEEGDEIYNESTSIPTISYSDITGCGGGWAGHDEWGKDSGNNMDADPLFVDPGYWDTNGTPEDPADDIWVNGDYHLSPDSPCIDAGDNFAVPAGVTTDLDGNPRITNDFVDMGAYEYCDYEPEIEVIPLAWHLGYVELGESNSVIVTISNTGNDDLTVDGLGFASGSDPEFEIAEMPTLPLVIAPEDSVDIEVVFTPSSDDECYLAGLEISSDDADEPVVTVNLSGCGVPIEIPPSEQIQAISDFIESGDVAGTGGQPYKKIEVLLNMVGSVSDLIAAEDLDRACQQLLIILQKCDGESPPADFVENAVEGAIEELAGMIEELMEDLGC